MGKIEIVGIFLLLNDGNVQGDSLPNDLIPHNLNYLHMHVTELFELS